MNESFPIAARELLEWFVTVSDPFPSHDWTATFRERCTEVLALPKTAEETLIHEQARHELFYLNVKALLTMILNDIPAPKLGQYVQHVINTPDERLQQEAIVNTWGGVLTPFVRELALTLSGKAGE